MGYCFINGSACFSSSQFGVTVSEKYTYCKKCFEDLPGDSINLSDDPTAPPK